MSGETLRKLGYKEGMRTILVKAPAAAKEIFAFPESAVSKRLSGTFDYIHLFVKTSKELETNFRRMKKHLAERGMLWISWPKSGALGTDLTIQYVIKIGYDHGLVESKVDSIDPTWSAIKFTFPKEGRTYNNSYGKLP
jgi:hypothetical protein